MNDAEIRQNFHAKRLYREHCDQDTLVIDELGLNHGACRADIAVINGHLIGYEIKSNDDSLHRLHGQVRSYGAVFDRASIVVGDRYAASIQDHVPAWWGVIVSLRVPGGAVSFETIRRARANKNIDPLSIARLLWRNEVEEMLLHRGLPAKILRQPREVLYEHLVGALSIRELRDVVRNCLKTRRNWRYP